MEEFSDDSGRKPANLLFPLPEWQETTKVTDLPAIALSSVNGAKVEARETDKALKKILAKIGT